MLIALLVLAAAFALLLLMRIGGARRAAILRRWPVYALGAVAAIELLRGRILPAALFAALAAGAWWMSERPRRVQAGPRPDSPEEVAARALLGVGPEASEAEIRAAYRTKMAAAHPDRGGSHADAARLTAARDRLLNRRR